MDLDAELHTMPNKVRDVVQDLLSVYSKDNLQDRRLECFWPADNNDVE